MSQEFVWASTIDYPPARWDLRLFGWRMHLADPRDRAAGRIPWLLDCRAGSRSHPWRSLGSAGMIAAVGADDPRERALMLESGLGEALSARVALVELSARLACLKRRASAIPRHRMAGPARLDLFHRDARFAGNWLGLHPREFALLWRLAECPGARVSRRTLLSDVWRLDHVPETNSVEVHVSRLRAKLAISRLGWLVETHPGGGYRLADDGPPGSPKPVPRPELSISPPRHVESLAHAME